MIRPYKEEDRSSILQIYAASKMDELENEKRTFQFLPLMQDTIRAEKLFESEIFVFENPDVVGYCAFYGNEIRAMYVDPEHRGKGVGKRMFEFMLNLVQGKSLVHH